MFDFTDFIEVLKLTIRKIGSITNKPASQNHSTKKNVISLQCSDYFLTYNTLEYNEMNKPLFSLHKI